MWKIKDKVDCVLQWIHNKNLLRSRIISCGKKGK